MNPTAASDPYTPLTRILVRYALVMTVVALLAGISFQESAKRLDPDQVPAGLRLEAVLPLGLVHGHVFTAGVLLPLALAGALHLARRAGGREVGPRARATFAWLFLPFTALSLALLLLKGYHVLLAVRGGETDLATIDASYLGGHHALRYGLYGVVHGGMGLGLAVLVVALWRSLGGRRVGDGDTAQA